MPQTKFSLYVGFALLATAVNLVIQGLIFTIVITSYTIYIAIICGTIFGLITKYFLDKKWIFFSKYKSIKNEVKKFSLYSLTGIFTTIIFWTTEFIFFSMINIPYSQYVGGFIGLSIGYIVKYHLDKKFVFLKK